MAALLIHFTDMAIWFLVSLLFATSSGAQISNENCAASKSETESETVAWRLFACLNRKTGRAQANATELWRTWASPDDLLCSKSGRNCDPTRPPSWPKRLVRDKTARLFREQAFIGDQTPQGRDPVENPSLAFEGGEEIRFNKLIFDYVADHSLWFLEGQEAAFLNGGRVDFPLGAIEVKAFWIPVEKFQRNRYLWRTDRHGNYFGLVALNVAAKTQPQWFWATFEHVDNPKRCAYIPCSGSISGVDDTVELAMSSNVRGLLQREGLDIAHEPWWLNYRLHGTQTAFVTTSNQPTLLGNSILEAGFRRSSSCITCHSRATRNGSGEFLALQKNAQERGFTGLPEKAWFCDEAKNERKFLSLDYVWSLTRAESSAAAPSLRFDQPPRCDDFEWLRDAQH